ncbi:methylglutaconyl-CoA hydratase, mitochondrial [Phymastichus coffea]|uniref:methylglutaconyl-CoA hydratase, mitochondrial n=1 Tax=Phymastichus coffea TaxID=108790 RepID=UPI00273B60C8|nr:methylglutaconyl-CoA hydratase, mitochondrial [Phymastichus coffea]XP_058791357.1 methylglutaconyl-CoA hydratase, mitochondrial [Phymastichus coffea]
MVQLILRSGRLARVAGLMIRALSTQAQPHPVKDESRELIVRYLDGKDNGIAVLGLNRGEARNSLSKSLLRRMAEAVSNIERDKKVRVLIVRSLVPKVFCAGADLRERVKMEPEEVGQFVSSIRGLMRDIENLSAPVIAALDGHALGGGLEMALACDIRTAAADSKLGLVETKLAIIPGAGGTQRLPRIVGPAIAKEMIFTAKVVDGREAQQMGLVNRVVEQNKDGDAAYQQALQIAREILPNGPIGVKLAKVAISKGIEVPIDDGLEIEKQCYAQLLDTEDRLEGLAAFAAKRVPVYRGL